MNGQVCRMGLTKSASAAEGTSDSAAAAAGAASSAAGACAAAGASLTTSASPFVMHEEMASSGSQATYRTAWQQTSIID